MASKVANVFVIIDVQNCFMAGGSFGGPGKMASLIAEIKEIYDTVKPDYVVVTRDVHPSHHASHQYAGSKSQTTIVNVKATGKALELREDIAFFMSAKLPLSPEQQGILTAAGLSHNPDDYTFPGGSYPPHCRATTDEVKHMTKCASRTTGAATESDIWDPATESGRADRAKNSSGRPIIGTKLSQYFKASNEEFANLLENPNYKLSIEDKAGNQTKLPSAVNYQFANTKELEAGKPPVLELLKGQLCNWDALSAFQYHANFDTATGGSAGGTDVPGNLDHTTCLAEILCSTNYGLAGKGYETINIIACGLVGEICVKATVAYGMNTFLNAKRNGKGLAGYSRIVPLGGIPLPVAGTIPKIHFTYSTYGSRFVPITPVINGIRKFINDRVGEAGTHEDITYTLFLNEDAVIQPGPGADPSTWGDVEPKTKQTLKESMFAEVTAMKAGGSGGGAAVGGAGGYGGASSPSAEGGRRRNRSRNNRKTQRKQKQQRQQKQKQQRRQTRRS